MAKKKLTDKEKAEQFDGLAADLEEATKVVEELASENEALKKQGQKAKLTLEHKGKTYEVLCKTVKIKGHVYDCSSLPEDQVEYLLSVKSGILKEVEE